MTPPADPLPTPPADPRPTPPQPAWVRVLSVASKLAVIGLIGVASWQLIASYRGVLPAGGAPTSDPAPTLSPTPADADWLIQSGGWSLGDTPWRVTRMTLTTAARDARLAAVGDPAPPRDPHSMETAVIGWLKQIDPKPVRDGPVTRYKMTLNRTTFRGVVEVTPAGNRLRLGQVSWPGAGEQWELLELLPLSGVVGGTAEPLLPPPAGAAVFARRWAGDRVVADLVGPIPVGSDPAVGWRAAGWTPSAADASSPLAATTWARGPDSRVAVRLPSPPGAPNRDYLLIFLPLDPNRSETAR